jgi:ATP-dependent Lon protease
VLVRVHGTEVGQVNGLSVMDAGPLTYGVPTRITASVAPGTNGIVDVESRSDLSGSIHTKGFQILEGLLRSLLLRDHVLSFGASLAFEQTYGRVDGDSASGAEICCLLSALTDVPVRQGLAMTGSVDQLGHVQAIGGVNEKIEGFFDTCRTLGFDGRQGVIIPKANVGDLMLRDDVVAACRARRFRVHAVERIHDALELLTGMRAGEPDREGVYPKGTLLRLAVERSEEFFRNLSGKSVVPLRPGRRRATMRGSPREPVSGPSRRPPRPTPPPRTPRGPPAGPAEV